MKKDNELHGTGRTGDLTIKVVDFGPIVEAHVDLRPLTIFVGPSNTGKSYLAVLLYALHRCFGKGARSRWDFSWHPFRRLQEIGELPAPVREHLKAWVLARPDSTPSMPAVVIDHVRSVLERAEGPERRFEKELGRCFGVDRIQELTRAEDADASAIIDVQLPRTIGDEGARYRFELERGGVSLKGRLPQTIQIAPHVHEHLRSMLGDGLAFFDLEDDADLAMLSDDDDVERELDTLFLTLVGRIFSALVEAIPDPYYLPADRTGVMHSHQVVVSTLIQHATTAGLRPSTDVPMLSGVLADFLSQLIELSRPVRGRKRAGESDLADRLEQHILQGVVHLNRPGTGYPSFTYRPQGWTADLPLMRASSMVSELAPVALYLRHLVRPGDLLIIEEPEAHLHPGLQAAFARELARLVTVGVRIVMTTHSEWVLEQFGNLVRMSGVPETAQAGIVDADCAILPEQVGAWLFNPSDHPRGAVVTEIDLDPETGLYPARYEDVSEALYNESAAIFNRTQKGSVE